MIKEVEGDILLTKAEVIAHGVAPNDNFAHGLALALRERWPGMYKDFRHYCQQNHPETGGVWTWSGVGPRIVNLFTQAAAYDHGSKPGRATLEAVGHALKELKKEIQKEGFKSVALPKLATGVGGLEWADVKPLIEKHLAEVGIPVYVYSTYHAGVQAQEA